VLLETLVARNGARERRSRRVRAQL
jgi:hypothetical protein